MDAVDALRAVLHCWLAVLCVDLAVLCDVDKQNLI